MPLTPGEGKYDYVYRDLPDQPRVVLYHGTSVPMEVLRTKGLQAHNPRKIMDFVLSRVNNPRLIAKDLAKFPKMEFMEWGIVKVTGYKRDALSYASGFPEIIISNLSEIIPKERFKEAILALVEIRGDFFVGKLVTLSIPVSWLDHLNLTQDEDYDIKDKKSLWEVAVPWDIPPKYFSNIEIIMKKRWEKVLEEDLEIYYEEIQDLE